MGTKPNHKAILEHAQKLICDGRATVDLPRELARIYESESWREWSDSKGKPFETFLDALTARQPYGLGVGQYASWIDAAQLWALCTGYSKMRKELLRLAADQVKPIAARGSNQHSGGVDIINSSGGTSAAYLLGRLKRDHPEVLARLQSGELTSVRKAAIDAGIVKTTDSDRDRCPVKRIKMYWKRATASERKEFIEWLGTAEAKHRSK